ncbi:MAG TPA: Rrf2 family transcriptional regulator [Gemmataceae bacterium]|jgi:Rrf2 family protein|nr:Rrf2 family transcriptional regulator [Gemmataceae bacterium]
MRISAKAEYACIAMVHLALHYRDPVPVRIKAIADAHGIPQRFLVQILLQLKTARLVASVRGASGGYQIAKSPEKISLAEIINCVVDRSQAQRSDLVASPSSGAVKAVRSIWEELQEEEQRTLERLTLGELTRRAHEKSELSYQI